jgi:hypothetical protein
MIPTAKLPAFWHGFNTRKEALIGNKRGWLYKLFNYDPGQNLSFWFRRLFHVKRGSYLEVPGRENCSSACSSILYCAAEEALDGLNPDWIFKGLPTEKIAPGHPAKFPELWQEVKAGEPLLPAYWYMNMKYGPIPSNMSGILAELWNTCKSLASFVAHINNTFADGIREEQRDDLKIPEPYYMSTHARLQTWADGFGSIKLFSQEEVCTEKVYREDAIWAQMQGDQPHIRVFKPLFIYGQV